jgi:hypothetical protein
MSPTRKNRAITDPENRAGGAAVISPALQRGEKESNSHEVP